jgi:hypothetical protein
LIGARCGIRDADSMPQIITSSSPAYQPPTFPARRSRAPILKVQQGRLLPQASAFAWELWFCCSLVAFKPAANSTRESSLLESISPVSGRSSACSGWVIFLGELVDCRAASFGLVDGDGTSWESKNHGFSNNSLSFDPILSAPPLDPLRFPASGPKFEERYESSYRLKWHGVGRVSQCLT